MISLLNSLFRNEQFNRLPRAVAPTLARKISDCDILIKIMKGFLVGCLENKTNTNHQND